MLYNKIYNPITNRYVSIYSKVGKQILQKYLNGGSSKQLQLTKTSKHEIANLYKKNIEKMTKIDLINGEIILLTEQMFGRKLRTTEDYNEAQNYLKEEINKNLKVIKISKNKGVKLTDAQKNNIQYTFIKQLFILLYLILSMESRIKNLVELLTLAGYDVSKYLNNKFQYLTNLNGGSNQNPFVIPEDQEQLLAKISGMSKKKKLTKSQRKKIQKEKLQEELEKQKRLNEFKKRVAYLNSLPSYEEQVEITPANALGKPDFNTPEGQILLDILTRDNIQPLFEVYKEDKTTAEQRRKLYENVLPLPMGYDDSDVPEFSYKMNELFASETAKNIVIGVQILNDAVGMAKSVQSFVEEFRPSDSGFLPPEIEAQIPAYSTGRNAIIPKYVKDSTSKGNTSSIFSAALDAATDLNEKLKKADPFKIGPPGAAAEETQLERTLSSEIAESVVRDPRPLAIRESDITTWESISEQTKDIHMGVDKVAKGFDSVMEFGPKEIPIVGDNINVENTAAAACLTLSVPGPHTPVLGPLCLGAAAVKLGRAAIGVTAPVLRVGAERAKAKREGQEVPKLELIKEFELPTKDDPLSYKFELGKDGKEFVKHGKKLIPGIKEVAGPLKDLPLPVSGEVIEKVAAAREFVIGK